MSQVREGRWTAGDGAGMAVFLIGMRINRMHRLRRWLPVATAMPRMLRELRAHPELGLLGARTYVSGRVVMVVQYWRDTEHLAAYAASGNRYHLPAWREFNRRSRGNADVGIFHETYVLTPGSSEALYAHMPPFGLAAATQLVPVGGRGHSFARRLNAAGPNEPVVAAP